MSRSVIITASFLSPEEVAARLGVSRQRQQEIAEIVGSETRTAKRKGRSTLRTRPRPDVKNGSRAAKKASIRQPAVSPQGRTVSGAQIER